MAGDSRMTRREVLRLLGLGASTALLAACSQAAPPAAQGPAAPAGQPITMKIGTATINDIQHEWCKRYGERVQNRTNGRIKVEIYPASQLGSIPRMIEGVQLGTIEAWIGPPDFLVGIEPRMMVPGMPLLFRDMDEAYKVLSDPKVASHVLSLVEDKGIKGVSLLVYGPMVVFDRKPVRTPEDMRGRKYRVFAAPTEIETMNSFGATGVPMALGEVVSALQQGTVDGVQTGITVGDTFKFYDIVKYVTDTNHAMITSFGGVSKLWYDQLPADIQRVLMEEGLAVHKELLEWQKAEIAKAFQTWAEKTGDGVIRLSEQERAAFHQRLRGVRDKVLQQRPELRETIELFEASVREARR